MFLNVKGDLLHFNLKLFNENYYITILFHLKNTTFLNFDVK